MTDVFISYSRKDQDFVRQLFERLSEKDRAAWVDWEGIPVTADWWQEIAKGIDAADNFLFIISPDSVMSQVCNREIEYAVAHNKRLIPIVRREAVPEEMNKALARHNWLYAREGDDFDEVFDALIDALNTDLVYVQGHTRLLVRAREWEKEREDASYLLRGSELSLAETWLEESGGKEPKPTELQTRYLHASRRVSNARQRTLLAGVSVALAATVALALIAVALFGVAENRRQESEQRGTAVAQQAATATNALGLSEVRGTEVAFSAATAIAAEATSARRAVEWQGLAWAVASERAGAAEDHDLELALALQAMSIAEPPPEVQAQMFDAAYAPGAARVFAGEHAGWVTSLDVSADGRYLLSSGMEGTLALWDTATGELLHSEQFGSGADLGAGAFMNLQAINAVAFHPTRSNIAVTGTSNGTLTLWDVAEWQPLAQVSTDFVEAVAFSPDGRLIAVGMAASTGNLGLFDAETLEVVTMLDEHSEDVISLAFSPDGALLLAGSEDATASLWEISSRERLITYGPVVDAVEPDIDIDGLGFGAPTESGVPTIILATNSGQIIAYERDSGEELLRYAVGFTPSTLDSLAVNPFGYQVATAAYDGLVSIWDSRTGRRLRSFRGSTVRPANNVVFSRDGLTLYAGSQDGTLRRWYVRSGAEAARFIGFRNGAGAATLAFAPDGLRALVGGGTADPALLVWDLETGQVLRRLEGHPDAVLHIETMVNDAGNLLALTSGWDPAVRLWNIDTGDALRTYDLDAVLIPSLDIATDSRRALVAIYGGRNSGSHILDLESGELIEELDTGLFINVVVMFSPDESRIFIGGAAESANGRALLFDASTREVLSTWDLDGSSVNAAAFSADGTRLLVATQDGQIFEYAMPDGTEVRRYVGHSDVVSSVTFSPDERWMLSTGYDDTARVWDAQTGLLLFTLMMDDDGREVQFGPDGLPYTVSRDGGLTRWLLARDAFGARDWALANRVVRDFTCAERQANRIAPLCE
ncbi:MAG: TIR domain-containing protein [Chloroflexi bacterium]|nr:TIR domain-containing protein [Chloroflexota bacterium]